MVYVEVDYRQQLDTTFASIHEDEEMDFRDTSIISCRSNARDTSTSPRDSLEELRQSHTSILNVTSDGEESDDDDEYYYDDEGSQGSCLFNHLNEPPRLEEDTMNASSVKQQQQRETRRPIAAICCPNERSSTSSNNNNNNNNNKNMITDWLDTSTNSLRNVTESFAESMCPGGSTALDEPCGSFSRYVSTTHTDKSLQYQMEMDILALLGCSDAPTDEELDTWATPLLCTMDTSIQQRKNNNKAHASNIRSRVHRVHRFRKERQLLSPKRLKKSQSLDNSMLNETNVSTETSFHDAFGSFLGLDDDDALPIGHGLEPIQPYFEHDNGYDSDPEVSYPRDEQQEADPYDVLNVSAISHEVETGNAAYEIISAVQESLNYTWALTWHPTKENMQKLGNSTTTTKQSNNYEPQCVQLWFERGHILHYGHTIVEPRFMWREYLTTSNIVVPHQMRLLNVCRAIAVETVDRTKYPLARSSHSFILRMVSGDEFLFEASSESERNVMVQRWKLVVARLATLAVFEDVNAMQNEFFSHSVDPQTLHYV